MRDEAPWYWRTGEVTEVYEYGGGWARWCVSTSVNRLPEGPFCGSSNWALYHGVVQQ